MKKKTDDKVVKVRKQKDTKAPKIKSSITAGWSIRSGGGRPLPSEP